MTLYTRLKLFSRQVFILASVLSSIRQTKATEARSKALAHTQLIEPTGLFHPKEIAKKFLISMNIVDILLSDHAENVCRKSS